MTVDDGQIMAIGGLLDDNERRTLEKTPILGDIPVLGELFKSRSRTRGKTNLMVFIRPTIMRTAADARKLAEQRYGYIRDQQLKERPDREPTIDELLRDYMGIEPPISDAPSPEATFAAPATVVAPPAPATSAPKFIPETRSRDVIRPVELPPSRRKSSDPN